MGTQHLAGALRGDVEGVLQGTGRVVGQEVQRVEVEVLCLDLRSVGDLPAHADEDVGDLLGQDRDRVLGPTLTAGGRHGDVDALGGENLGVALLLQGVLGRGECLLDPAAGLVDQASCVLALILRQRAEVTACRGHRGVVAEVATPEFSQLVQVPRLVECLFSSGSRRLEPGLTHVDFVSHLAHLALVSLVHKVG